MPLGTATGAGTRRAVWSRRRIGLIIGGVCLPVVALAQAQPQAPVFTVPRIIPTQPERARPQPAPRPAWLAPLVVGRFAEALDAARGDAAAQAYIRGREAERSGRLDEAEQRYREAVAIEPTGEATVALAELLTATGRRAEAEPVWRSLQQAAQADRSGITLSRAGRAAQALGEPRLAMAYFQTAANLAPDDPRVHTRWADLFAEKFETREAQVSYETALEADPAYLPARLGLARVLAEAGTGAADAAVQAVLDLDPLNPDAWLLRAVRAMDAGKTDDAKAALARVGEVNANHVGMLSLLAAQARIEDRVAESDALRERALAISPRNADVSRVIGERLARQYRFDEAVTVLREAVALDPTNSRAQAALGLHLMRTGAEGDARTALETAFAIDAYDRVTYNLLTLLDTLESFTTIAGANVTVKLHPDEAPVLRPYLVPLAEQALAELSARYDFTPQGPILVEMFPKHDDFAVRTMGLPGMLGALGACFGKVVTLDSPRARTPGTFNWAATLWHEMAHVITLQMSGNRLPRWLSEGISTYEEGRVRTAWGRESELLLAQAYADNRLLPLADLNSGFSSATTINLAYQQAALLVSHLVEAHGEEKLRAFVGSFREGLTDEVALTRVYGRSWATLQPEFDAYVKEKYGATASALASVEATPPGRGATAEDWTTFADSHPGSFRVQMTAALPLVRLGEHDAARRVLERASALVPYASGDASPWRSLVTTAMQQRRPDDARRFLERMLEIDHTGLEALRQGLEATRASEHAALRERVAVRLIEVDPFDAGAHTVLGELALTRGDVDTALRELQVAVDAGPPNPADALTALAEATLKTGQRDAAKQHLIRALEVTPRHERAQDLLLQIVDGPGDERQR